MLLVYLFILFLLFPRDAFAWGPGTHLEIAHYVLANLGFVLPAIRKLIEKYPREYIYGSVSPDIIQGKKYAGYRYHCHNWDIGMMIVDAAKTESEQSSAYGYLSHLAADTVAHNYFVPFKMMRSYSTRSLSHIYWEMRFDLYVDEAAWQEMDEVVVRPNYNFDRLLEAVLKRALFSFKTDKRIFNSLIKIQKMKQLRRSLKNYARASRWSLDETDVQHYKELTFEVVRNFLANPHEAECLVADPAGRRKLAYAMQMRRELKRLQRSRKITRTSAEPALQQIKEELRTGLFDPQSSLSGVSELFK